MILKRRTPNRYKYTIIGEFTTGSTTTQGDTVELSEFSDKSKKHIFRIELSKEEIKDLYEGAFSEEIENQKEHLEIAIKLQKYCTDHEGGMKLNKSENDKLLNSLKHIIK